MPEDPHRARAVLVDQAYLRVRLKQFGGLTMQTGQAGVPDTPGAAELLQHQAAVTPHFEFAVSGPQAFALHQPLQFLEPG